MKTDETTSPPKSIMFTRAKLEALKEAYQKALGEGVEQFEFEGHPLIVGYAKYLIEYLNLKFRPDTREVEYEYTN